MRPMSLREAFARRLRRDVSAVQLLKYRIEDVILNRRNLAVKDLALAKEEILRRLPASAIYFIISMQAGEERSSG